MKLYCFGFKFNLNLIRKKQTSVILLAVIFSYSCPSHIILRANHLQISLRRERYCSTDYGCSYRLVAHLLSQTFHHTFIACSLWQSYSSLMRTFACVNVALLLMLVNPFCGIINSLYKLCAPSCFKARRTFECHLCALSVKVHFWGGGSPFSGKPWFFLKFCTYASLNICFCK